MKKFERAGELLWLLGILFVALGVAICSEADLGVSMIAAPAFVISEAVAPLCPFFTVGVTEYLVQGALLLLLIVLVHRCNLRFFLTFAVAVIYGYTLNLFLFLLSFVSCNTVALRWILLLTGDVCVAFGVACFFRTYLPLQVFELFVAEVSDRFRIPLHKMKSYFDMCLLALSLILAFTLFDDASHFDWRTIGYRSFHSIGAGTLVTTAINAPRIRLMGRLIDRLCSPAPRFLRLHAALQPHK